tara:strand:+ start:146 stop:988 length:843 start_codon:yes stop_codon:yes gene_type:complete
MIIDTDSANEIDDLLAIIRSIDEPKFRILGVTASQFHSSPYASKNTALESYKMNKLLKRLLKKNDLVLKTGSPEPMSKTKISKPSEATKFIINQTKLIPAGKKLHIVILGSCTNVASAIIHGPEIVSKLKISYVGFWHNQVTNEYDKNEFNTRNDSIATNFLLDTKGLDFNVMSASVSKNLIFNKNETFKNLGNNKLGNFIKKRWNTYKRWWTSEDSEKRKWVMWDLALIEAIAKPSFSKINTYKTPPQNLERNIKIYTYIDSINMKIDFWRHYNKLINK